MLVVHHVTHETELDMQNVNVDTVPELGCDVTVRVDIPLMGKRSAVTEITGWIVKKKSNSKS